MVEQLTYPAYERERFNTEVPLEQDAEDGFDSHATAMLSPFHVPMSVQVHVSSDGSCTYEFIYSNDEPAEREFRKLHGDPCTELRIGKNTRKVIEVRFRDAIARLEGGDLTFDPSLAESWCSELPEHAQFACSRNTEVISAITKTTPDSLRKDIVRLLRRIQSK